MSHRHTITFFALSLSIGLAGCPTEPGSDAGLDAPATIDVPEGEEDTGLDGGQTDEDAGHDGGSDGGGNDAPDLGCGDPSDRPVVVIDADITANTTWTCDNIYEIDQVRYVAAATGLATLTIEPGTLIRGEPPVFDAGGAVIELPGALVVSRTGRLVAEGTEAEPIVFTSATAPGSRLAGDWGGLVLLGRAPNNVAGGLARLEGLPLTAGARGRFGVDLAAGETFEPSWNCGSLRYVRVEYAGFVLADSKELNGITLGSCGTDTRLSYVQIHVGLDDGIEFFGGASDVDHLVITGAQDDGIDWDNGFTGRIQFAVVQQYRGAGINNDSNGIEADNDPTGSALTPLSEPRIFNLTLIGTSDGMNLAGLRLRRNTRGFVANAIVTGFAGGSVDIDDDTTIAAATSMSGLDRLVVRNIIAEQSVLSPPSGTWWATDSDALVEATHFLMSGLMNRETTTGSPPTVFPDPLAYVSPGWVPVAGSTPASGAVAPGEAFDATCEPACAASEVCRLGACLPAFFDASATYVGAFEPGGPAVTDWSRGWTTTDPD